MAVEQLAREGIRCHLVHAVWLKPFLLKDSLRTSLNETQLGLVVDSDFEVAAAGRSIAYELMHETGHPVHALGLEDRSAGFAARHDNGTPTSDQIVERVRQAVRQPEHNISTINWE